MNRRHTLIQMWAQVTGIGDFGRTRRKMFGLATSRLALIHLKLDLALGNLIVYPEPLLGTRQLAA